MKITRLALAILAISFMLGLTITPVFGQLIQDYTNFPATDDADDVSFNNTGSMIEFEGSGDYADWVDLVKINITGADIIVEFQGAGEGHRSGYNYTFAIAIDVDNDRAPDFIILTYTGVGGYVLQNQITGDSHYMWMWDGLNWASSLSALPTEDSGRYLTFQTVVNALSDEGYTLSSTKFRCYVYDTDLSTYTYADFLPDLGGAVPGFQILPLLFSIVTVISVISLFKMKKQ